MRVSSNFRVTSIGLIFEPKHVTGGNKLYE